MKHHCVLDIPLPLPHPRVMCPDDDNDDNDNDNDDDDDDDDDDGEDAPVAHLLFGWSGRFGRCSPNFGKIEHFGPSQFVPFLRPRHNKPCNCFYFRLIIR